MAVCWKEEQELIEEKQFISGNCDDADVACPFMTIIVGNYSRGKVQRYASLTCLTFILVIWMIKK